MVVAVVLVAVRTPTVRFPTDEVAETSPALNCIKVEVALAFCPPQVVGVQAKAPEMSDDSSDLVAYVEDAKAWREYGERKDMSRERTEGVAPMTLMGLERERYDESSVRVVVATFNKLFPVPQ